MPDDALSNPPDADGGSGGEIRRPAVMGDGSFTVAIEPTAGDDGPISVAHRFTAVDAGEDVGVDDAGLESSHDRDSFGGDLLAADLEYIDGDDDDVLHGDDAGEHQLRFSESFEHPGILDVSRWAPLLAMLDANEHEASPDGRPFNPAEGVEGAHALELRAESMRHYAERGARRTGTLDRTEIGLSDENRDVVAGRDAVEVDGMLDEHTGHGLVHVADEVEVNVGGRSPCRPASRTTSSWPG